MKSGFHYNGELALIELPLMGVAAHGQPTFVSDRETRNVQALLRRVRQLSRTARLSILSMIVAAGLLVLSFAPRIPLGPDYHRFVDKRAVFQVPNGFDVLSNVPFLLVGLWGVVFLMSNSATRSFREGRERIPYIIFFVGVALTGVGSGIYHLAPNNDRLIWDLLPMTFSFVALLAATFMERVSVRGGLWLLLPLIFLGAASVFYWYAGELRGHGDLRFYLFVQFFPVIVIAAIIAMFPPAYSRTGDFAAAFALYVLAKVFELLDQPIYSLGRVVSGHTLKHLTAGVTCYWILRMLKLRTAFQEHTPQRRTSNPVEARIEQETISLPTA